MMYVFEVSGRTLGAGPNSTRLRDKNDSDCFLD